MACDTITKMNQGLTLPGRQHYGRYSILLLLVPVIEGTVKYFLSLPVSLEKIVGTITTFAVMGAAYLLILWVLEIIRFRGGIERPQNHSARTYAIYLFITTIVAVNLNKISLDFQLAHQFLIPTLAILRPVLGYVMSYFAILLVLELIRLRGDIERPINKIARKIFSITIIVLALIAALGQWLFASLFGFIL